MKRFVHYYAFALVATLSFLLSCEKKQIEVEEEVEDRPVFLTSEGVLKFASEKDLSETISTLRRNQEPEKLTAWETQWKGFTSMRTAFDAIPEAEHESISLNGVPEKYAGCLIITGQGENREARRQVSDPVWATILNEDGVVYIGARAYKISYENIARVENYIQHKGSRIAFSESSPEVKIFPIIRNSKVKIEEDQKSARTAIGYNNEVVCIQEYWHGGFLCCKKRFVGEIETTGVSSNPFDQDVLFTYIYAASKHQRRTTGIWWNDEVPELRLKFESTVNYVRYLVTTGNTPVTTDSFSSRNFSANANGYIIVNNANIVEVGTDCFRDFAGIQTCGPDFTISSFTSDHIGVCDDGQTRSCANNWP